MNNRIFYKETFLLLALSAACLWLSGCSGAAGTSANSTGSNLDAVVARPATTPHVSTPVPSPTPTQTPGLGTDPLYQFDVAATGYDPVITFKVKARTIVKVQFRPEANKKVVAGTGFTPVYSRLGVFIAVGDLENPTPPLSNGVFYKQETSAVMDYSSAIERVKCTDSNDTECREDVTITISKPNNDYWCYNTGAYCPYTHVYPSHPWAGTLYIQTDDTVGMN